MATTQKPRFPKVFAEKVNISKVDMAAMKKWIEASVNEILPEDDVVVDYVYELLVAEEEPDIKAIYEQVTAFLEDDTMLFLHKLWSLMLEAQKLEDGVPKQLKKEELVIKRDTGQNSETGQKSIEKSKSEARKGSPRSVEDSRAYHRRRDEGPEKRQGFRARERDYTGHRDDPRKPYRGNHGNSGNYGNHGNYRRDRGYGDGNGRRDRGYGAGKSRSYKDRDDGYNYSSSSDKARIVDNDNSKDTSNYKSYRDDINRF